MTEHKTTTLSESEITSHAISVTKRWLTDSVIKHQFCPYAKQPHDQGLVDYHVFIGNYLMPLLEMMAQSCLALDHASIEVLETTLVIVAGDFLADFDDYLDVLDVTNAMLEKPRKFMLRFSDAFQDRYSPDVPQSWSDSYQIASFHPDYCFADAQPDDKTNYTNRSPFPTFHLLRNDSIEKVRMDDDKADRIVSRNMSYLNQLAEPEFAKLVALSCQRTDKSQN